MAADHRTVTTHMSRSSRTVRRTAALLAGGLAASGLVAAATAPASAAPTVRWSDATVVAGKPMTAAVAPGSVPDGASVVLQRRFPEGWQTTDSTPRTTDRGLVLDVATGQYGDFAYRVAVVQGGGSVTDASATRSVTIRPPYNPLGRPAQHGFLSDPRYRYDSCETVTWAFYDENAPRRILPTLQGAVKRSFAGTGLTFRYVGRTNRAPSFENRHDNEAIADVIVGWVPHAAIRRDGGASNTVGLGGSWYWFGYEQGNGEAVSEARQGALMLSAKFKPQYRKGFGNGRTWGQVLMHEWGHVLGLAHVGARSQIMYPIVSDGAGKWGEGDLLGLRRVGDTQGCLTYVGGRVADPSPQLFVAP